MTHNVLLDVTERGKPEVSDERVSNHPYENQFITATLTVYCEDNPHSTINTNTHTHNTDIYTEKKPLQIEKFLH